MLNIGAGTASAQYQHERMFAATEYHTLEPPGSGISCTYETSATNMHDIPSDRYDWVYSQAVLEHVDDPWAAAREHVRVTKPGGFIYVTVPFSQQMHPAPTFGDYWRFTPQGLKTLLSPCFVHEIELGGESPLLPLGVGVLMQKPGPGILPPQSERWFWMESGNDEPFETVIALEPPSLQWTIHRLTIEPMQLAMQLNGIREQIYAQTRIIVSGLDVARRYRTEYSRPFGIFGVRAGTSFLDLVE